MKRCWMLWGAAVGLLLTLAPGAGARDYTFTRIADTSGPFKSLTIGPGAIAANGAVAFQAPLGWMEDPLVGWVAKRGIYTGRGGAITPIAVADPFGPFVSVWPENPAINAGGTVAFRASPNWWTEGIYASQDGVIEPVVEYGLFLPSPLRSTRGLSINAGGTVAFLGTVPRDPGPGVSNAIFTARDGVATMVSDPAYQPLNSGAINAGGTVTYDGYLGWDSSGFPIWGICTSLNGVTTTIVDNTGPFRPRPPADINAEGTVAFAARLATEDEGVYISRRGVITTIADTGGPFLTCRNPAINAGGTVVFRADLDAGGSGIFTGPDPVADKVIALGGLLFGSTVSSLGIPSLNDAGQVAFYARLASGLHVIVRADPR